jgi:hypothetical protein
MKIGHNLCCLFFQKKKKKEVQLECAIQTRDKSDKDVEAEKPYQ